jgi:hypothetical protein
VREGGEREREREREREIEIDLLFFHEIHIPGKFIKHFPSFQEWDLG